MDYGAILTILLPLLIAIVGGFFALRQAVKTQQIQVAGKATEVTITTQDNTEARLYKRISELEARIDAQDVANKAQALKDDERYDTLHKKYTELLEEVAMVRVENRQLKIEVDGYKTTSEENKRLKDENKQLRDELITVNKDNQHLRTQVTSQSTRINALETELSVAKTHLAQRG